MDKFNNVDNNFDGFYKINPYDNFPFNYTKNGQEEIKQKLKNSNVSAKQLSNNNPPAMVENYTQENFNQNVNNNANNFNISQMLPLLLSIGAKNGSANQEMLNTLMPMFSGKNNGNLDAANINKLMQFIMKNSPQKANTSEVSNTEVSVIDKLEKI